MLSSKEFRNFAEEKDYENTEHNLPMKKTLLTTLSLFAIFATAMAQTDLNKPFGWTNCTSLTSGDDYTTKGGNAVASPKTVTLKATGNDDKNNIANAIKNNQIIILDGTNGDFTVSSPVGMSGMSNKTIVGINGAKICTKFYLTEEMRRALDDANVKSASTSSGTGGTLTNGQSVSEAREFLTRQTLIDLTKDNSETYRSAGVLKISSCTNIIIRNIKFVGPGPCDVGGSDLITATGNVHLWVDHCDFTDGQDGNFDLTNGCNFCTVSWCTFSYTERAYDHANSNLVGSSDSNTSDEDKLNITFAYNLWGKKCNQRMPMARFGTIHLLNNYYNCPGASLCVNPRKNSEFLIQGNYFEEGVMRPFSQSSSKAYTFDGNYYASWSSQPANKGTVSLPYAYTAIHADDAKKAVSQLAGATLSDPLDITGISTAVSHTVVDGQPDAPSAAYNILGQRVADDASGLVIVNGRKILRQ